jgi:hypothetical protein
MINYNCPKGKGEKRKEVIPMYKVKNGNTTAIFFEVEKALKYANVTNGVIGIVKR